MTTAQKTAPAHNFKAIIFDFDGTIFDTETTEFLGWQQLYRQHGQELLLQDWQRGVGTWGAFDPWAGLPQAVQAERETVQNQLHADLLQSLQNQDLRPGVREVLQSVRPAGLRLGLASSSDRDWVMRWLRQHDLLDLFEVLATRYDVEKVKPDPALYLLAAQQLGLHPSECLAVEDSLNGATAAVAAGMRVVMVPNQVTESQPFPATWARLAGYEGGLAALLAAASESE